MRPKTKRITVVTAIAIVVVYEARSRWMIMERIGSDPISKAEAYHGAMTLYGNLAEYFGRKAIMVETEYWKVVRNG